MDFIIGGLAGAGATIFSNPMDVIKCRLQLQGELKKGETKQVYRGVIHGLYVIAKADGIMAVQKGLSAALIYGFVMNGIRLGIYKCAEKQGFTTNSNGEFSLIKAAPWAWTSGIVGTVTGNPASVIKIRLQSGAHGAVAVGHQHNYKGFLDAVRKIYKSEGIPGFFTGATAMALRLGVGSLTQLTSFTMAKETLKDKSFFHKKPILLAFAASLVGGGVVAVTVCPFDVVTTRLYNQASSKGGPKVYNGVVDCFIKILRTEGLYGLFKGVFPLYLRLAPHTTVTLVIWDTLDRLLNHKK